VEVRRVEVVRNDLTRTASDHLPLVVDIVVGRTAQDRRARLGG
jgi:endonuclease/exonuclease/phosphatase family metal-dependent hydrolase